jgi:hypothetical protein
MWVRTHFAISGLSWRAVGYSRPTHMTHGRIEKTVYKTRRGGLPVATVAMPDKPVIRAAPGIVARDAMNLLRPRTKSASSTSAASRCFAYMTCATPPGSPSRDRRTRFRRQPSHNQIAPMFAPAAVKAGMDRTLAIASLALVRMTSAVRRRDGNRGREAL